jgi:hypothetical protein
MSLDVPYLPYNPQLSYSYLSAAIGSTFVARRAGTKQAPRATPASISKAAALAQHSKGISQVVQKSFHRSDHSYPFRVPGSKFRVQSSKTKKLV